jgi:diguanylate cyclase
MEIRRKSQFEQWSQVMTVSFCQARDALAFLESHQLEPSPINYELALTHHAGAIPDLSSEIDKTTEGGFRLCSSEARALVRRFLAKSAPDLGAREKAVARQTKQLGVLTSEAHAMASCLERDVLAAVSQMDERPEAASEIMARLSDAERELAELRNNIAKLQSRIDGGTEGRTDAGCDALSHSLDRDEADELVKHLTNDGRRYVLVMFGLDELERLNENYGRSVSENIINSLARTLRESFSGHYVLRWTENHFIVIIKDMAVAGVKVLVEEALLAMSQRRLRLRCNGEPIGVVTASAGIVVGQHELTRDVLEQAVSNLASASESGGNRVYG